MASALSGDGRRRLRLRHGLRDAGALARRRGDVVLLFRNVATISRGCIVDQW